MSQEQEKVKLKIKFYGSSYHIVKLKSIDLEFDKEPTFREVLENICSITKSHELCFLFKNYPYPSRFLIVLNGLPVYEISQLKLRNGDEIAIIDIVSGGGF